MDEIIAIDWGSTNLRAHRLSKSTGTVIETRKNENGVSRIAYANIPDVLDAILNGWPAPNKPILMSGMIGSSIGWEDAGYVKCPTPLSKLRYELKDCEIANRQVRIVPGLSCRSAFGEPDVMRGEESQLLGVLSLHPELAEHTMACLPGTHSKWVRIKDGIVQDFHTAMTGDVFDCLSKGGLLRHHLNEPVQTGPVFDEGVSIGAKPGNLTRKLFTVRARTVMGEMEPSMAASFGSGLLIGSEISESLDLMPEGIPLCLVGADHLIELYQRALSLFNREVVAVNAQTANSAGYIALFNQGGI